MLVASTEILTSVFRDPNLAAEFTVLVDVRDEVVLVGAIPVSRDFVDLRLFVSMCNADDEALLDLLGNRGID